MKEPRMISLLQPRGIAAKCGINYAHCPFKLFMSPILTISTEWRISAEDSARDVFEPRTTESISFILQAVLLRFHLVNPRHVLGVIHDMQSQERSDPHFPAGFASQKPAFVHSSDPDKYLHRQWIINGGHRFNDEGNGIPPGSPDSTHGYQ
jgi:hypothetical protein